MRTILMSVLLVIVTCTIGFAQEGGQPDEQTGVDVGTEGGRIDQANMIRLRELGIEDLTVEFPEACINQQIRLQVNLPTDIPAERAAIRAVEFVVEGHENGFSFNKPVTIEVPYPEDVPDETPLTLMYWNRVVEQWEEIEQTQSIIRNSLRHVVQAQVNHFSVYGVVEASNENRGVDIGTEGGCIDQTNMIRLRELGIEELTVEFPEACINQQIRLQVNLPTDIPAERAAIRAVEFVVEGHENGFSFNKPVTIEVPYPEDVPDETPLTLMYWNRVEEQWEEIEQTQSIVRNSLRHVVQAQVNHFSVYGVVEDDTPTIVEDITMPQEFELLQNYPNPFNPVTTIPYNLMESCHVKVAIYNLIGQHVITLIDEMEPAGLYSITWDGTDQTGAQLSNGIYFCRMEAGTTLQAKRLILMK